MSAGNNINPNENFINHENKMATMPLSANMNNSTINNIDGVIVDGTNSDNNVEKMNEVKQGVNSDLNNAPTNKNQWVKFDEDNSASDNTIDTHPEQIKNNALQQIDLATAAVLTTESVHVNFNQKSPSSPKQQITTNSTPTSPLRTPQSIISNANVETSTTVTSNGGSGGPAIIDIPKSSSTTMSATTTTNSAVQASGAGLRTIELSSGIVREGFANGDVIVTLLPVNTKWPWVTPAVFRPELVPEELMAQGLTLTVEEYVHAMETLVNDFRFTLYNVCYKRVLVCWILFAFTVLLAILFSGLQGIALFTLGIGWLFLNAAAIFFCMWMKLRLSRGLEKCMARVNKQLLRHKIIIALDDRGRISCHKVNLCFMYFDPAQCIAYLNEFIERSVQNGTTIEPGWEARLDVSANDIVIQGASTTRLSRKQERGSMLFLRYASRWGNELLRGLIDVSPLQPGRHSRQFICPCQFIEDHLKCKPRGYICGCCITLADQNNLYHY